MGHHSAGTQALADRTAVAQINNRTSDDVMPLVRAVAHCAFEAGVMYRTYDANTPQGYWIGQRIWHATKGTARIDLVRPKYALCRPQ